MKKILFKVFLLSFVIFGFSMFNGHTANAALVDDWNELFSTSETGRVGTPVNTRTRTAENLQLHSLEENHNEWIITFRDACLANDTFGRFENAMDAYSDALDSNGQQIFWLRNNPNNGSWTLAVYELATSYTVNMSYGNFGSFDLEISSQFSNLETWDFGILNNSGTNIRCDYNIQSAPLNPDILMGNNFTFRLYQTNIDFFEYAPQDFDPEILPEQEYITTPDELLTPEYKGTVSESGLLKVQYLKNLTPFLTGTTYTNIDQMNTNWNGLDSQVGQWVSQPAGLMQEEIQLSGAGYYMLNISHNQQLDSPPWPENHNYTIEQVWIQFYWDGKSFTEFTNLGCSGQICNDFTDDVDPTYKVFSSLGIPLFGFQQVVLKPLEFLNEISNETQNCTPLNLPLPFIDENITMPCMTPIYQNNFGNILLIYQTILTGLFAYYVGLNTFRGIKDLSNPRDDSIEVGKL